MEVLHYGMQRTKEIYGHLRKDNLLKRMVKNIVATTIAGIKNSTSIINYTILHYMNSEHLSYTRRALRQSRLPGCHK